MNKKTKEQISALIDNELDEAQRDALFDAMRPGSEELAEWERMHRVSAAFRGMMPEEPGFANGALADRIRKALKDEPTRLAPGQAGAAATNETRNSDDDAITAVKGRGSEEQQPHAPRKVAGWIGSLAIAASVSAVVLFGFDIGITKTPDAGVPDTGASPVAAVDARPATDNNVVIWPVASTRWESAAGEAGSSSAVLVENTPRDNNVARNRRLNALLVAHAEFSPASAMNGMSAYARFVSYDPLSQGEQPKVTQ